MTRKARQYLGLLALIALSCVNLLLFQPAGALAASPDRPGNISPSDGSAGISLTPTLESSDFYDSDGDRHTASQWQITTTPGDYTSTVFDSQMDSTNLVSIMVPAGRLTYLTTYYWHVRYRDSRGTRSLWSVETSFTTLSESTPPVISGVAAVNITPTGATITWTTDEAATSQVEYGLDTTYGRTTAPDPNLVISHSANLTDLSSGTTYHYRVKSMDGAGNPATSGDYVFTTPDITGPVISNVTAANVSATGATITWTTDEAATSQVEYGRDTTYGSITRLDAGLVTSHSVNLAGLSSQTTYHYRVKSTDGSGNPSASADRTFMTPDVNGPVISSVDVGSITATGATITWTTDEAASSQVEYGLDTMYGWTTALDSSLVTSHSASLTGLTPQTTYHYRVKSRDASGLLSESADSTFSTAGGDAAFQPVVTDDGASTTSLTRLHASWTVSEPQSGIAEYQYAIGTSAGGTDVCGWTSAGKDTEVSRTGLALSVGATYYFSVKARDGKGQWSAVGVSDGIVVRAQSMSRGSIISPAGGAVRTSGGRASIEFPAGAVVDNVTVDMSEMTELSGIGAPQGFAAGATRFLIEAIDADGNPVVKFSRPVLITVRYSEDDLTAARGDAGKLVLAYYDEAAGKWKRVNTSANTNVRTLTATTTHLSQWTILAKTASGSKGLSSWVANLIMAMVILVALLGAAALARRLRL